MMDPVDEYINMCFRATPYLNRPLDFRDIVYSPSKQVLCRTLFKDIDGQLRPVFVKVDGMHFVEADDFFMVWQGRQLKEMISESGISYSHYTELRDSTSVLDKVPKEIDGSFMESALLLALIIHDSHGKAWNGEDWVDVEKE